MIRKEISAFKVAATYIGTVVGAGFASGQEILQFFVYHGINGIIGLLIAIFMFVFYGYVILRLGNRLNASSYKKVIMKAGGPLFGRVIDSVVTFFLFGALSAMIAGCGAIFEEQFGLSSAFGGAVMAVLSVVTVLTGIGGVISAISFVVPLLLLAVIIVSIFSLFYVTDITVITTADFPFKAAVKNFALSGILYASYNLLMAVAILAPLGQKTNDRSKLRWGAILGGIGLGLGAFLIFFTILINMPTASLYEIPMLYVAGKISPVLKFVYSFILIAEIYTTAVGNLYGFAARFTEIGSVKYKIFTVASGGMALIASGFGFAKLVHYLYPIAGYGGIIMLIGLTYRIINHK